MLEGARCEADELCADADAALVQGLDGDLVSLADRAEHVGDRDDAVVENQLAGRARTDAELVLFSADGEPGRGALDEERGDAAVGARGIDGGEDEKEPGLEGVGDPELASGEAPDVAVAHRARGERERVAARARFRERVGAHGRAAELRKEALALRAVAPAHEGLGDERVLHVDAHRDRRVDARQLLDGEHRHEERRAGAAVRRRHLDSHEAERKQLLDQAGGEARFAVHAGDERPYATLGEVAHGLPEELLVGGENRERADVVGGIGGHTVGVLLTDRLMPDKRRRVSRRAAARSRRA